MSTTTKSERASSKSSEDGQPAVSRKPHCRNVLFMKHEKCPCMDIGVSGRRETRREEGRMWRQGNGGRDGPGRKRLG
jgi:hypothetical protein